MLIKLLNWHTVVFIHLQALHQEEARLDTNRLIKREFVSAIVDLGNEIFHFIGVERSDTHEHLVQHDSQGPRVHLGTVATLFQKLRRRVQRRTTDAQVGVRAVKDSRQTEVRDLHLEVYLGEVN